MQTLFPQTPEWTFAVNIRKHLSYTQVRFRGFRCEYENKNYMRCKKCLKS